MTVIMRSSETPIEYRRGDRAVFLLGFAKCERGNIDDDEVEGLKERPRAFLALNRKQIAALIAADDWTEVDYGETEQDKK
jgi:hypothetical protein